MIKRVLKRLFPVPLLKRLFLIYNKARILTVDRLLFPELHIAPESFMIYRKGYPFRELTVPEEVLPAGTAGSYMRQWYDWTQEEFLLHFRDRCLIEPDYGWAIVRPNRLLYYSLGVSRTWFQPKPSIWKLLRSKKMTRLARAVSLRDTGEQNYFHFFNDVLAKIFFLLSRNIDLGNRSMIINSQLWEKPYFRFYLEQSPLLRSLNWTVQQDEFIECDDVIFCKPLTHRRDLWEAILAPFAGLNASIPLTRIYVTRGRSRLRFIENQEEIEAVCRSEGFQIVDADTLTPPEQVLLFSTAEIIAGIHGAGLTNMIFRNGRCRVLEIFPPPEAGYLPYHYIMLATMRGFAYDAVIGKPGGKFSGGFYLDPEVFKKSLQNLVTSASGE